MIDVLALVAVGLLLAVWVAYPAVMFVLGRLRRRMADPPPCLPTVTIVIATRESEEVVRNRVRNCLDTEYPSDRLDLVVAWDLAARSKPPLGLGDCRVREVTASARGKAAALNAGVACATGDITVFADSHQRFDGRSIPELVWAISRDGVGAVSGNLQLPAGSSLAGRYWSFERWLRCSEARWHSTVGASGAIYAIRRELWRPLPIGLILDDVYTPLDIVMRGWRVDFAERAIAFETRRPTPNQEYARKVRTLTGVLQLCAWRPPLLLPFRNPVWLQFLCHKLLRLLTPYALLVLALWIVLRVGVLAGPAAPMLVAASIGLAAWLALASSPRAAQLRRLLLEGALLQLAVLTAGVNGLRGRWQVWDA